MSKDKKILTPKQLEAKQRRLVLSSMSRKARTLRELKPEFGEMTINQILMLTVYNRKGNLTFKKFREWKEDGYTIKKGEKGFMLWAQPLKAQKDESKEATEPQNEEGNENSEFFPVCYLFSNEQVIKPEPKEKRQENKKPELAPDLNF